MSFVLMDLNFECGVCVTVHCTQWNRKTIVIHLEEIFQFSTHLVKTELNKRNNASSESTWTQNKSSGTIQWKFSSSFKFTYGSSLRGMKWAIFHVNWVPLRYPILKSQINLFDMQWKSYEEIFDYKLLELLPWKISSYLLLWLFMAGLGQK